MSTPQAAIAWRLFELNWVPLGAMGAALALCLIFTDFSLEPLGAATSFGLVMRRGGCGPWQSSPMA